MQHRFFIPSLLPRESRVHSVLIADVGVSFALVVFPNILLAISFLRDIRLPIESNASDSAYLFAALQTLELKDFVLWAIANLCLLLILCALQRHVFCPMLGIIRQLYTMRSVLQEGGAPGIFSYEHAGSSGGHHPYRATGT